MLPPCGWWELIVRQGCRVDNSSEKMPIHPGNMLSVPGTDETVLRMRSVPGKKYHYIRNYSEAEGFPTLNRYREKCFSIKPLMRQLLAIDQLSGPALELMQPMPYELLYYTEDDPHEISNLSASGNREGMEALTRMRADLDTWEAETNDLGRWPVPKVVVAPFEKEMHDWFGTPAWCSKQN